MPTIEDSSDSAFCWPMVCPVLVRFCGLAAALLCTCPPVSDSDCSAVLAAPMMVLTLVIVLPKAEMFASCDRAATANPSLTPMPAYLVDFRPVESCVDRSES